MEDRTKTSLVSVPWSGGIVKCPSNSIRPAPGAKHGLEVTDQLVRALVGGKVSALGVLPLKDDGPRQRRPAPGHDPQVPGEPGDAQRDPGDVCHGLPQVVARRAVAHLVVDAQAGGRAGGGEVIDGDPSQDLVVGPGVVVGPVVELLVDPGQQGDGRVGEGEAQGGGPGALLQRVSGALEEVVLGAGQAGALGGRVPAQGVPDADPERPEQGGPHGEEVDVRGQAVLGVEKAYHAGDEEAPVASLGDCARKGGETTRPREQGTRLTVSVVAERGHDLVEALGVLREAEALFGDGLGEAEAGQRRGDDVERRAAVVGLGEPREDLDDFEEAAGPYLAPPARIRRLNLTTGKVAATNDSQPWQNNSGMPPSRLLRWCTR
ncbi:hypothetical protein G6O67_003568 [Ophiocordyceps sinensis]|uniref:Uncharacterized protein n=1 Tax=Ophiocordyceps sinensis TaxID=72228 RepID=A0A8H4PS52_9HYPO|nr:hypothetical protein G6O67_003568 [Ophiocordyceps sinensis]